MAVADKVLLLILAVAVATAVTVLLLLLLVALIVVSRCYRCCYMLLQFVDSCCCYCC